MLKIYYIGNYENTRLKDYGEVLFINYNELEKLDVFNTLQQCDLLLIEVSKRYIDKIIRWIFNLHCKTKIPVLAILDNCNNRDKLKLDKVGVRDYIDKDFDIDEMELKIGNISRLLSWQKQCKKT